ncbi:MAG: hypothetical protein HQK53_12715 [Oligoflexia bacterium]|nr:hypothetical protein [Oligoflexia bacterium]
MQVARDALISKLEHYEKEASSVTSVGVVTRSNFQAMIYRLMLIAIGIFACHFLKEKVYETNSLDFSTAQKI